MYAINRQIGMQAVNQRIGVRKDVARNHGVKAIEAPIRQLLSNRLENVILVDAEGMIQHFGPEAASLAGVSAEVLEGAFLLSYIHTEDVYPVMRGLAEMVCEDRASGSWKFRFRARNGQWQWLQATAVNLLGKKEFNAVVFVVEEVPVQARPIEAEKLNLAWY